MYTDGHAGVDGLNVLVCSRCMYSFMNIRLCDLERSFDNSHTQEPCFPQVPLPTFGLSGTTLCRPLPALCFRSSKLPSLAEPSAANFFLRNSSPFDRYCSSLPSPLQQYLPFHVPLISPGPRISSFPIPSPAFHRCQSHR